HWSQKVSGSCKLCNAPWLFGGRSWSLVARPSACDAVRPPPGYCAGTITSRSKPDSAPQASPDRPSICRTLARSWFEGKLSNFSVTGSNRTMALMLQSVSQTLSLSSTHTERSEEHTSELQSPCNLVCRLLLEKKKNK